MFKPALVFMDLDGTLLDPAGRISPRTRAAVAALLARGVQVILASGRPPRMARWYYAELNLAGPAICYNGALVTEGPDFGTLWERRMPPPVAAAAVAALRREGAKNILVETDDLLAADLDDHWLAVAGREDWGLAGDLTLERALASGAHKLAAVTPPPGGFDELSRKLRAALPGLVELVTSTPGADWLEVLPAGAGKAKAAAELCRRLGFTLSEAAAFGDAANDADLLAQAGLGVAMGNGDPRVKAAARRVAPPNSEDGLARTIEEMLA